MTAPRVNPESVREIAPRRAVLIDAPDVATLDHAIALGRASEIFTPSLVAEMVALRAKLAGA